MNVQTCAIDNGYKDTKVKTEGQLFKFSSRVYQTTEDNIEGNTLEYDGAKYKVGEGQEDIDIRKTKRQVHKICTLAALGQLQGDENREYRIVVALPLMNYKNREMRDEFKEYMMRPNSCNIRWNGYRRNIIIRDVLVFAQGGAALYADPARKEEYKKSLIAVLDWGGLTINGFVAENLMPIPESMFTVNLGTIILNNRIRTGINEKMGMNVQDYEIPYLLRQPPRDMEKIITDVQEQHFDELLREMRKKNWSIETLPKLGVGGGFLAAGDIARKYLPKLDISSDPVYANANGLFNVGRMVFK